MLTGRSTACAAAFLLACTSGLSASDTTFVSQGVRVKVFPAQPGAKAITGNVADLALDTLIVLPEGRGEALTFAPHDLRKIEVSQGKTGVYAHVKGLRRPAVQVRRTRLGPNDTPNRAAPSHLPAGFVERDSLTAWIRVPGPVDSPSHKTDSNRSRPRYQPGVQL